MMELDVGTGYGRKPGTHDRDITEVAPGTPMGELLRRYWQPVALVEDACSTPRQVRILGEDLVLFRDGAGRAGLVEARCCHRGTSLYYGRVEESGIRCCYHGWLFDVQGQCLERPCEPKTGPVRSIRQPWYPVEERYGLIFAYMGPPEKKPVLPRYAALENLLPHEVLETDDQSLGAGGPAVLPCNWLQHVENIVDPAHIPVLHESHSGPQFGPVAYGHPDRYDFDRTPYGVCFVAQRALPNGMIFRLGAEIANLTMRVVPTAFQTDDESARPTDANPVVGISNLGWTVPIDDTHFMIFNVARSPKAGHLKALGQERRHGRLWSDLTPAERREWPGDFEAQSSQGPITRHSDEHLGNSDRGVVMFRRFLREQLAIVAQGGDPVGISFDADAPPVEFSSKKMMIPADAPEAQPA